jgi:late competence protein required for DNA uptake (superfamily II DNA/RNA helicase)
MGSANDNQLEIFDNFRVECDMCKKLMDWERAQILPGKILCRRCLTFSSISEWFAMVLFAKDYIKEKFSFNSNDRKVTTPL